MDEVGRGRFYRKTGTKVQIAVSPTESNYVTAMRAGTAKYDIYVLRANTYDLVVSNAANYSGYECILADLDDVYNSEVEEGVLFKDKMKDMYEQYNRVDAKTTVIIIITPFSGATACSRS